MSDRPSALPSVEALGNGQVLLRGRAVVDAWRLAHAAADQLQRRDGIGLSPAARGLLDVLRAEAQQVLEATMSADGPADVREVSSDAEGVVSEPIGTEEVAKMLNQTERHVRRIASSLGGRQVHGRWVFDRAEVVTFLAERNDRSAA